MRTPEETVRAVAAGVCRLMRGGLSTEEESAQIDELADCYAEHTDVRHPFSPLGDTPLLSRAALREHFGAGGPVSSTAVRSRCRASSWSGSATV